MSEDHDRETAVRRRAYAIWEQEGRPEGQAWDHWLRAKNEANGDDAGDLPWPARDDDPLLDEAEKILAGRTDVNMPALLTRDVQGG